jgi:hypothetical protein
MVLMSTRQTVVFTEPQHSWLRKRAKELGISVSELIRRMVDEKRDA